ncbi:MAG: hypothetical protein P8Y28_10770 [Gammaproteobacteria bacterium]
MSNQPKMPSSIVDAQVQRLLEIVEEYRKQQCDGLLTQAQQDSSQIIRQAYREARSRMHQDIQDSREHMRNERPDGMCTYNVSHGWLILWRMP